MTAHGLDTSERHIDGSGSISHVVEVRHNDVA
jgi:hypothetical protein